MEQQEPRAKFPQTVPPNWAPHDPSVVTGAVDEGAAVVVVDVAVVLDLRGVEALQPD
jgi:hypothetical protein